MVIKGDPGKNNVCTVLKKNYNEKESPCMIYSNTKYAK